MAIAMVVAACSTGTGPGARPADPAALAASLNSFVTLVSGTAFNSFRGMGPLIAVGGTSPVAPIFADSLLGRTYLWNDTTHAYALGSQDTVPATGIRFILYAGDSATGRPIEPATQIGRVDLLDGSLPDTTQLHTIVDGGTPQTTFDYLLRGAFAADTFTAAVSGCLSDANTNAFCAAAAVSQHLDQGDTLVGVTGSGEVPGATLTYATTTRLLAAGGAQQIVDVQAQYGLPTEVVRMTGTVVFGATPSANLTITVDGVPFATIQGTGTLTVRGPNGGALTLEEQRLVFTLFSVPGWLLDFGRASARPGQQLLS